MKFWKSKTLSDVKRMFLKMWYFKLISWQILLFYMKISCLWKYIYVHICSIWNRNQSSFKCCLKSPQNRSHLLSVNPLITIITSLKIWKSLNSHASIVKFSETSSPLPSFFVAFQNADDMSPKNWSSNNSCIYRKSFGHLNIIRRNTIDRRPLPAFKECR